jgi:hypothetical protein
VSQCEVNSLVEGDAHGRLRYSSAREQGHERQRETSKIAFYGEVPVFHGTAQPVRSPQNARRATKS